MSSIAFKLFLFPVIFVSNSACFRVLLDSNIVLFIIILQHKTNGNKNIPFGFQARFRFNFQNPIMSNPLNPHLMPEMWIKYTANYYEKQPSAAKPSSQIAKKNVKRFGSISATITPNATTLDPLNIQKQSDVMRLRKLVVEPENCNENGMSRHTKKGTLRKSLSAREDSINNFNYYKLLKFMKLNNPVRHVNAGQTNNPAETNTIRNHFGSTSKKDDKTGGGLSRMSGKLDDDLLTFDKRQAADFTARLLPNISYEIDLVHKKSLLFLISNTCASESDMSKIRLDKSMSKLMTSERKASNLILHKSFDQTCFKNPQRKANENYMRHKLAAFQLGSITDADVIRQQYRRDNALGKVPKTNTMTNSMKSFTQRSLDTMHSQQAPVSSLIDFNCLQKSMVFQRNSEF